LSGWFSANHSIGNLTNFLAHTHNSDNSLRLTGQSIFPDWIQTLKQGETPITDVSGSFLQTFIVGTKTDDTGEPTFENGTTTLSDGVGNLNSNRQAYTGRTNINPSKSGWK
jgi:hypothetical protein